MGASQLKAELANGAADRCYAVEHHVSSVVTENTNQILYLERKDEQNSPGHEFPQERQSHAQQLLVERDDCEQSGDSLEGIGRVEGD
jgi:hypothetical protein